MLPKIGQLAIKASSSMRIGGPSDLFPAGSGESYFADFLQSTVFGRANIKRPCSFWHPADVKLKAPLFYSL